MENEGKLPLTGSNYSLSKSSDTVKAAVRTQIDINEIKEKTIGAWSIPIRNSHLFGDLCRLSSRISFTDRRPGKKSVNYIPKLGLTNLQHAKQLLNKVIRALESKESVKNVQSVLNQAEAISDGALWIGSVFQVLGNDSLTAKFLMATHQGIITSAATQIKVVLFSKTNQFTKDVQGKDGWKIDLVLSENEILISHFRKEQSMIAGNNEYSFEWKLDIYLNNFQSIEKIGLLANNLKVGPNCDPILYQKIQECLEQVKS